MRRNPARHLAYACAASLALGGCGKSEEAKVLGAIEAKFPAGLRRCMGFNGLTGIKVGKPHGGVLYYQSKGATSPLRHAFVFYAAVSDAPVPDLVRDLLQRGVIQKQTVTATVYRETNARGNDTTNQSTGVGIGTYTHTTTDFEVDIFETEPFDERFSYAVQGPQQTPWSPPNGFPSRVYPVPVSAAAVHWPVPVDEPYATSTVTGACLRETPDRVIAVRVLDAADGGKYEEADVEWAQHPPEWMATDAFRRAVLRPDTVWIDKPRTSTVVLSIRNGALAYGYEKGKW